MCTIRGQHIMIFKKGREANFSPSFFIVLQFPVNLII